MRQDTITFTQRPFAEHPFTGRLVSADALTEGASVRARLEADARLALRTLGVFYIALWGITWLILAYGGEVLRPDHGCRLEGLSALVLWRCTGGAHLPVVADLANGVLASTVWAPVVVLAAAVQPEVRLVAFLVVGLHVVGLPAALLIAIRGGERLCDRIARRSSAAPPGADPSTSGAESPVAKASRIAAVASGPVAADG
ncbi:hypothetical protein, partial [Rhodoplanes sp. SY1]|uniref:hypothetical protein n=1 Tax=Rhodoplanes sp. SY1 TaxID=3166646 RepID=UPI0038B678B5